MKILVTGSAGFIGGYVVEELLRQGHQVVGIDNYSKYGKIKKSYDIHPAYTFIKGNVTKVELLKKYTDNCDYIIALAAKIGGISYFHTYAYDLLAENERIIAATFDAAIDAFQNKHLRKIIVVSSSMVYESANIFPTPEKFLSNIPPPQSTYGFQKLSCEYFAKGAWEQYKLPYTIVRPFNCVGIGETKAIQRNSSEGNKTLALSHVVPDLVYKMLSGQSPVEILGNGKQIRHYTYGGDLAKGICLATFSNKALNEDFNLSTETSTTVLELAKLIWEKIYPGSKFTYVTTKPFIHDVQKRIPDTKKAKKILGFSATTSLDQMLDEIIPWIAYQIKQKKL